jgi:acyl-CoA thioester hydrolase
MSRPPRPARADYRWFTSLDTRWMDNDIYGHVNNVVYYSYFDTAIAHYLIGVAGLRPLQDQVVAIAVDTGCRFHSSLSFPDRIAAGLRVGHLGTSSVRWEVGIFRDDEDLAAADGHFVHVFVERPAQRPTPIPQRFRSVLEGISTIPR